MKIADIANEIYMDAGSPDSTSIPAIAFWVRGKVGTINTVLYEDFVISADTFEILDGNGNEILPEAVAVIKQMYRIYDYEVQIRAQMNALAQNGIIMAQDGDTKIQRINRNEVSKTLASIRKDELETLKGLVAAYRSRSSPPSQVAGDDTQVGVYTPYSYFHYGRPY